MKRLLILMILPVLLAGCGSASQNTNLGPDAGGGFDCSHNALQGCVNPGPGSPFVSKAQIEH